jgi:pimeloyl-ACP methyl ester carboxylesterase
MSAPPLLDDELVRTGSGLELEVFRGGSGPLVVYLHPASGLRADDRFACALAQHFEVVAPLSPGVRDLAQLDDIRDIHDLAMVYDDLFSALRLRDAVVVGHSFGGMVAAEVAAHSPHRVEKLALIAPVGLWNDAYPVHDIFATPPARMSQYLWSDPASPAARAGLGLGTAAPDDDPIEGILRSLHGLVVAGKFMIPIPDRGLGRRLYRLTMPTLLVWGTDDKIVPARYADDFCAALRDARVELFEGAGHMVTLEQTDRVIGVLDRFARAPSRRR